MSEFIEWAVQNDYTAMWLVYMAGVIGLFLVAWRITRSWPRWLGFSIRVLGACVLLVPAMVGGESQLLAPAAVVAPFEWLVNGPDAAAPALTALVKWSVIAIAVLVALQLASFFVGRWWRNRRGGQQPIGAAHSEADSLPDLTPAAAKDDASGHMAV